MIDLIPTIEKKEAKKKKPPYLKPDSVKELEKLHTEHKYKGRDIPYQVKTKLCDNTANGLAGCLKAWSDINGAFFQRNNSQGQYDAKLKKWRRSGSTKGIADVQILHLGKTFNFEIKIGKDRLSEDQKKVRDQITSAGGHYAVIKCFDDFIKEIL